MLRNYVDEQSYCDSVDVFATLPEIMYKLSETEILEDLEMTEEHITLQ